MTGASHSQVIAIDGGGTRCRVAAHDGHETIMIETGSANVSSDFDGAVTQITEGLGKLAARLECPVEDLLAVPAFAGLAGVVDGAIADRLRDALPFHNLRVTDDRIPALRGALGPRDGAIAHCGTGSFFAARIGGTHHLAGGWGPVLGDEASAVWVGRKALALALETVDGRHAPSPLCAQLLTQFGGAPGIVDFAGSARPSEFGAIAPLVTQHAGDGDPIAMSILQTGAEDIARGLRHVGWTPGLAICLTGGIGPHFAPYLPEPLRSSVTEPAGAPLDGAIALAQEFAQELAGAFD
ncbi:ATPase [Primorskyibacter aestuariivivens]|uniref:BadF/BadG/BcrA/BcrD ATPase family protein n=1 Tax=Primorskyibacter aestuariivivens TaxID=1888912 RepID=UPI002301B565|nr:BadF/BadG/BcrA/BcrD ATPase family protein [Primorskyibacter aestuariivivens]MDA7427066.1 ATPase [Primorskyibacter aestuariivivens]